jgi:two-component system, OmpR family, sensor kinase
MTRPETRDVSRPADPDPHLTAWGRVRDFGARQPLRVRLVALTLTLLAVALVATGIAATAALHDYLVGRIDSQLHQSVGPTVQSCRSNDGWDPTRHAGPAPLAGFYSQCFNLANQPSSDPTFQQADTAQTVPKLPQLTSRTVTLGVPFDVTSADGSTEWRMLYDEFRDPHTGDPVARVLVGVSLDETNRIVAKQIVLEIIIGAVVLVLLALIAYVLVRESLRPLVSVERTAEAIAGGDLTRRVPAADPRTEVGGLALALNAMLGQIETAFEERRASEEAALASEDAARTSEARMRRFIADASHELRTPLTSIRGFAELYRQHDGHDPEVNRIIGRIEHHAARMGFLVEDLLLLARLDQQRPLESRPVDMLAVATDAVIDGRVTAPDHTLRLKAEGDEPPTVLGDEPRLRQVLGNLVTNALTHTPAGTEVTVTVRTEGGWAVIDVADNGPGMAPEDAARVFERFYRTDPSRARSQGGSGLGLSIVAALVSAHGGDVSVSTVEGEGATFTVRLPLTTR